MVGKQTLILTPNIAEIFRTQDLLDKIGDYIIITPPEIKGEFLYNSETKEEKDLISQIRKFDKRRRRY